MVFLVVGEVLTVFEAEAFAAGEEEGEVFGRVCPAFAAVHAGAKHDHGAV